MDRQELFRRAQRLFIEGKYEESIDLLTKAMNAGEETEIAYLSRGVAYLKLSRYDGALEDFGRAIEKNAEGHRAYYYRGVAYMMKGDVQKAIPDLDKCIALKRDNPAAFFVRGAAHAQLGNDDEAAKNLKTALINSESAVQGFADMFGILRTQFGKAIALMTGESEPPTVQLTESEIETLKSWLKE